MISAKIKLLPDSLANQIAAGEVVQRPASVVKELLENALDAQANNIQLIIENAGKTRIQVIDNGTGMSTIDARMCFERHATSKIQTIADLFHIQSFGFRGEALASIAAVSQVLLRTRLKEEQLGTEIEIAGTQVLHQRPCTCLPGTSITVNNLFYNVPARRNFLKSNPVELKHIIHETIRIALSGPHISLSIIHQQSKLHDWTATDLENRILQVFGALTAEDLIPINEVTPVVKISGFIGTPKIARKYRGEQFFFVNGRYIRDGYLNHAVSKVFDPLIPTDAFPFYVINIEIDASKVDVNIHPTKTEVKFEDDRLVYTILHSAVKKSLASMMAVPHLNAALEIPSIAGNISNEQSTAFLGKQLFGAIVQPDGVTLSQFRNRLPNSAIINPLPIRKSDNNIEFNVNNDKIAVFELPSSAIETANKNNAGMLFEPNVDLEYIGTFEKFILARDATRLFLIHPFRAHRRIIYERLASSKLLLPVDSQALLYPFSFKCSAEEMAFLDAFAGDLFVMGYDIRINTPSVAIVYATPAGTRASDVPELLKDLAALYDENIPDSLEKNTIRNWLAYEISRFMAQHSDKIDSSEEHKKILSDLKKCKSPWYCPSGHPIALYLSTQVIQKGFMS